MELDKAINNLDNVEQIDSELSALSSIDSDLTIEDTLEAEMLEVIGVQPIVDDALSETSKNPVQNRVVTAEINEIKQTYATKDFVEENGGKIDSISVNNIAQEIVNKNVNIDLSGYSTSERVDNLEDNVNNVAQEITNLSEDVAEELQGINDKLNNYATNNRVDEVESIAKGANQAVSFANYAEMVSGVEKEESTTFGVGQNIMIVELNVPDLWISGKEETFTDYTFTNNADFVEQLKQGRIKIGYYYVSALETQKVDLTGYREKITNANKLYATDENGNQTEVVYGRTTDAYGIVQRGAGGQIAVADAKNNDHATNLGQVNTLLDNKVDKEEGKGLSSNDFTQAYIDKIAELESRIPQVIRRI